MRSLKLIDKYYSDNNIAKNILLAHSHLVTRLAVAVASHLEKTEPVDVALVEEAAMLHDIGMLYTDSPKLGCQGHRPYIFHGVLGAEILRKEDLPRHALVCERHIGVGLSIEDIRSQQLPLPLRDMQPRTIEEEIVAYADLFYSKTKKGKRSVDKVRASLSRHGDYKVGIFNRWHDKFEPFAG